VKDGFLCLLKPPGMTSSDAVVMVRKKLPKGYKVGHMGTLDPEAAGVLPIGIGKGTRLFDYVSDKQKGYRAEICVGVATDTQDATGKVIATGKGCSEEEIKAVLPRFIGEITQRPSMYSAIKVEGKRLYEAARAGEEIEVPTRQVTIFDLRYVEQTGENRFLLDIDCGRGTYIRSLCADIGEALGTCAHMAFLCRTYSGVFSIENSVTPEEFLAQAENEDWNLLPLDAPLSHIPALHLGQGLEKAIRNGNPIHTANWKKRPEEGQIYRMYLGEKFVGMGETENGDIKFRCVLMQD